MKNAKLAERSTGGVNALTNHKASNNDGHTDPPINVDQGRAMAKKTSGTVSASNETETQ